MDPHVCHCGPNAQCIILYHITFSLHFPSFFLSVFHFKFPLSLCALKFHLYIFHSGPNAQLFIKRHADVSTAVRLVLRLQLPALASPCFRAKIKTEALFCL